MSENQHEGVTNEAEGQGLDVNELVAQINQLKSTNERLLNESKQYKTRKSEVEELQSQLKEYETKKLEEQGNWQEMLKREQEEKSQLQARLQKQQNEILKGNVYNAVANVAKDAHDISDLLAQSEYANTIEVDEDSLKPSQESIDTFVNSLREKKPYLFRPQKVAPMADAKPSVQKEAPKKSAGNMNKNELADAMKQRLAQALQEK